MWNQFIGILLASITLGYAAFANDLYVSLSIADIHNPVFSAQGIKVYVNDQQVTELEFQVAEIVVQGKRWHNLKLSCAHFDLTEKIIACSHGEIYLPNSLPLAIEFHYAIHQKQFQITFRSSAGEIWQFSLHWNEDIWLGTLAISYGQIKQLADWLPNVENMPVPGPGEINGTIKLSGRGDDIAHIVADLRIDELAFSDQNGLHAGENVAVAIALDAAYSALNKQWQWQGEVNWLAGEIFWQPLYFSGGGHRLNVAGILTNENITLNNGKIVLLDIGEIDFSGVIDRPTHELIDFNLYAAGLELPVLHDQILKPFLRNTAFSEIGIIGRSSLEWHYHQGITQSLVVDLHDVSLADQRDRFAFYRVNAHIPWQADSATIADISFLNGQVLRVPLGAVRVPLEINHFVLKVPQLVLPILDGKMMLENFVALQQGENWQWQFNGELLPVSLELLTRALQVPQMHGTISGVIPAVSYSNKVVAVDGTLVLYIFDGIVTAKNLQLIEPLGLVPHLTADLMMKNLDLGLITRTFSFGHMEGRVDVEIKNLELAGWQPVRFDAQLTSSKGSYPRRISQDAVQNISALGGASATAAIQRSLLRFFEEFSYSEIGWRCKLRNNICQMDGIEPASVLKEFGSAGYVIVKGGGIPAITVVGYNRRVNWQELISRLKRVTQGNNPVFQ